MKLLVRARTSINAEWTEIAVNVLSGDRVEIRDDNCVFATIDVVEEKSKIEQFKSSFAKAKSDLQRAFFGIRP